MKATDVIQPAVLSAPIAVNGSKDTIPQEQANALYPWYCSVENGFPDVTMQPLNSGGKPPRGQGMNGLLNVISDQKVYLQNGGVITFDSNVSNAIGGYPQGAILDYVTDSSVNKVISLIDDNTYNFVANPALIDGVHWQDISPLNKSQITNCILEAPNGVAAYTTSGGTSTLIAKEGLKILVPNGRNTDGTLKNIEYTLPSDVSTPIQHGDGVITTVIDCFLIYNYESHSISYLHFVDYWVGNSFPTTDRKWNYFYNEIENKWYWTDDYGTNWSQTYITIIGQVTIQFSNSQYGEVLSLTPYESVSLLKRTDSFDISSWAMPSTIYSSMTIGASGTTYTAPATGWFYLYGGVTTTNDWAALVSYSKAYAVGNGGGTYQLVMPVVKDDVVTLEYTNGANLQVFRFIYAQGEVW